MSLIKIIKASENNTGREHEGKDCEAKTKADGKF